MIESQEFYQKLIQRKISFFCGVPDSLLSDFSAFLQENVEHHTISANEGNAIALAAGSYLATGNPALVYLQNSGQGNTINPLISLTAPSVYGIPMLLLVGWRGEPGKKDEPQHMNQGAVTEALFETLDIPCRILPEDPAQLDDFIDESCKQAVEKSTPVAILVRKGTFSPYHFNVSDVLSAVMSREEAIAEAMNQVPGDAAVVATTGKISRELYSQRKLRHQSDRGDFLTVGSMGHASQIAMGIALEQSFRKVYCFDGDGAVIMHMGAMALIGSSGLENFVHILFNNAAHDSVGGQPTVGGKISFTAIARGCGYPRVHLVKQPGELEQLLKGDLKGPVFIEVLVAKGARDNLVRPSSTPAQRKAEFMDFLKDRKG